MSISFFFPNVGVFELESYSCAQILRSFKTDYKPHKVFYIQSRPRSYCAGKVVLYFFSKVVTKDEKEKPLQPSLDLEDLEEEEDQ